MIRTSKYLANTLCPLRGALQGEIAVTAETSRGRRCGRGTRHHKSLVTHPRGDGLISLDDHDGHHEADLYNIVQFQPVRLLEDLFFETIFYVSI